MITVLTGGTGGAKFIDGLRQIVPPEDLTLIVNTGDDLLWWGLYVSPDIDSITYVLAGLLSGERGWGVKGDTFFCLQHMGQLGQPIWFHTGDRDLAIHILRSQLLAEGKTLSEVTAEIADKLGVKARILPMSNSRVETRVGTPVGELSFEEYFVQRWYQDPVESIRFAGAADAEPAPGVIEAILGADLVLLAPSNPVTSIGPILAVPGVRDALQRAKGRVAAVSPIVGGETGLGPGGNSDGLAGAAGVDRRHRRGLSRFSGRAGGRRSRRAGGRRIAPDRSACSSCENRYADAGRQGRTGCGCPLRDPHPERSPRGAGPQHDPGPSQES